MPPTGHTTPTSTELLWWAERRLRYSLPLPIQENSPSSMPRTPARNSMMFAERLSGAWFRYVHRRNLVYNTCWEDPRLDREALDLGPFDRVVVITSAGCNALDYVLEGPEHIHAVDVNFRQNALLDLK